jgi:uncharacterized membrane protein
MYIGQTIPFADTWMHGAWGWGWMTLMMVVMVLFWGAVIFGIFWFIRGAGHGDWTAAETPVNKERPVEILERRFAEGTITAEEYRARREVLVNGTAASNDAREVEPLTG